MKNEPEACSPINSRTSDPIFSDLSPILNDVSRLYESNIDTSLVDFCLPESMTLEIDSQEIPSNDLYLYDDSFDESTTPVSPASYSKDQGAFPLFDSDLDGYVMHNENMLSVNFNNKRNRFTRKRFADYTEEFDLLLMSLRRLYGPRWKLIRAFMADSMSGDLLSCDALRNRCARLEGKAVVRCDTRTGKKINLRNSWSEEEDRLLEKLTATRKSWLQVSEYFDGRTPHACRNRVARIAELRESSAAA